jgi:DNA adenine methylase
MSLSPSASKARDARSAETEATLSTPLDDVDVVPFLKWPGGKRWFVYHHNHLFPKKYRRYIEPFLGGGAVFFHLKPRKAIIADRNPDLISAYIGVRDHWSEVEELLKKHQKKHSERHYYNVRARDPKDIVEQAARLIYLNRTCFNGIYRVNVEGKFNVPKGTKDSVILPTDNFEGISKLLRRADIRCTDFETIIDAAKEGDFVFADPPYTVKHNNNGFRQYNEKLFSWDDQQRLAKALRRARDRGALILSTNANHSSVRELYSAEGFEQKEVSRSSVMASDVKNRKRIEELVITANLIGPNNE